MPCSQTRRDPRWIPSMLKPLFFTHSPCGFPSSGTQNGCFNKHAPHSPDPGNKQILWTLNIVFARPTQRVRRKGTQTQTLLSDLSFKDRYTATMPRETFLDAAQSCGPSRKNHGLCRGGGGGVLLKGNRNENQKKGNQRQPPRYRANAPFGDNPIH